MNVIGKLGDGVEGVPGEGDVCDTGPHSAAKMAFPQCTYYCRTAQTIQLLWTLANVVD